MPGEDPEKPLKNRHIIFLSFILDRDRMMRLYSIIGRRIGRASCTEGIAPP